MKYVLLFSFVFSAFTVVSVSSALAQTSQAIKTVTEDRGDILVITTTRLRDAYPEDTCTFVTVQVIEKKTGQVMASDSVSSCQEQIL